MTLNTDAVQGAGLGLRRALMGPLSSYTGTPPDFLEVAPENWIRIGGAARRRFRAFTEQYPMVTHGLSLSLGGPSPLDYELLGDIRGFLREFDIQCYTEHLSYCSDQGHLYDLMPIPFTEEAVHYTADRIRRVQDFLGERIAVENVSYYAAPHQRMTELEFLRAVLEEADCGLLLDVNNIHVNSVNHGYDGRTFLDALPGERIFYIHVAGHYDEAEDLKVDTHGADVIEPVWDLLERAYENFGPLPTMLERDFNFPELPELMGEVDHIRELQQTVRSGSAVSA